MVTDQTAHGSQGIVFKQHPARLVQFSVQHQLNNRRDRCVDGAAFLTLRDFAVQATVGLV